MDHLSHFLHPLPNEARPRSNSVQSQESNITDPDLIFPLHGSYHGQKGTHFSLPSPHGIPITPSKDCGATKAPFEEFDLPEQLDLLKACDLPVISSTGIRLRFGNLFRYKRAIVCFIRHFFCPMGQDYVRSISRTVNKALLDAEGIRLVIISNGDWEMIQGYQNIFQTPFEVYTDPSLELYKCLGMSRRTLQKDPKHQRGSYIRHNDLTGTAMVIKNALKYNMPLFSNPGNMSQLGGEFILGPGRTCTFAHRMRYTTSHFSTRELLNISCLPETISPSSSATSVSSAMGVACLDKKYETTRNLAARKPPLSIDLDIYTPCMNHCVPPCEGSCCTSPCSEPMWEETESPWTTDFKAALEEVMQGQ